VEAREGRDPGGVRVLLSNPRWERRLVKFLELPGVGRVMANGVDEDEARAERMGGLYRKRRRGLWGAAYLHLFSFLLFPSFHVNEDSYSETCTQRIAEGDEFLVFPLFVRARWAGPSWSFSLRGLTYPLEMKDLTKN